MELVPPDALLVLFFTLEKRTRNKEKIPHSRPKVGNPCLGTTRASAQLRPALAKNAALWRFLNASMPQAYPATGIALARFGYKQSTGLFA